MFTSGCREDIGEPCLQIVQTLQNGVAALVDQVEQLLLLDGLDDLLQHDDLVRVAHPGVEDPARLRWTMLHVVEHSPGQHLLGEGHHVCFDTKVLVTPHLARSCNVIGQCT